jgi:hypothetical protein
MGGAALRLVYRRRKRETEEDRGRESFTLINVDKSTDET